MKKMKFTTAFLFFANLIFAQVNLAIHMKRSYAVQNLDFITDTLTIYKDGTFFKEIIDPDSFVFYGLVPVGKYSFRYKNFFNEDIQRDVVLDEKNNVLDSQDIELYVDKLQDSIPKNLFLQRIQNGEKISISFSFSGCFSSGRDSLIIYKKNDHFFLSYRKRRKKLKPKDIASLIYYENELRHLKAASFVSTTNGKNVMRFNSEKIVYIEPSIYWNGYQILKERLKIE